MSAVIGVIALCAIVGFLFFMWYREKKRREAIQQMANDLGLNYNRKDPYGISRKYNYLDPLRKGDNRYAFNVVSGDYRENPVLIFDYHYETYSRDSKGNRRTHHHYFSAAILHLAKAFPELIMRPEGLLDKAIQGFGFEDIDFDNYEFSKKFVVKCKDKKFAFDIFHTRMMEMILTMGKMSMEIEKDTVMIHFKKKLNPEYLKSQLDQLTDVREQFPRYLFAD